MKIFLIKHDMWKHDSYLAHVMAANTEQEVRDLAKRCAQDEGKAVWETAKVTEEGKYIGTKIKPFRILSDYNNA